MHFHPRATSAFATFLIALPLIAAAARWKSVPPSQLLLDQDVSLAKRLPVDWVDTQVARIPKVKERHEFWAFEKSNVIGSAVRVLDVPALREAMYPGYPQAMYSDAALWRDYFTRDFASTAWIPALQPYSPYGILVYQSWIGCMDIFKRYGADGVIFGSSETFRSLVPQVLSQELGGQKVLLCTTTSSFPQQAQWLAHEMSKPGMPRAKWAILGVSMWSFHQGTANFRAVQSEKKTLWDRYLSTQYGHYGPDFKTSEFFAVPSWDDVFAPNLSSQGKHKRRSREPTTADGYFAAGACGADGNYTDGTVFPMTEAATPESLAQRLSQAKPSFPLLNGLDERVCGAYHGDEQLAPVVDAISRFAGKVVMYVPPISPRLRSTIPQCYQDRVTATLAGVARMAPGKTVLRPERAEDYGLVDSDYLYVGEADGVDHFDANHTNYSGAVKVSRKIAELSKGELL